MMSHAKNKWILATNLPRTKIAKNIAKKYELNILGNKENIGILNAFIELVKNCKTKFGVCILNTQHFWTIS